MKLAIKMKKVNNLLKMKNRFRTSKIKMTLKVKYNRNKFNKMKMSKIKQLNQKKN